MNRIRGCLLGGAVGDALGHDGAITAATQMSLFTAEGLLRATTRRESQGTVHAPSVVYNAYLRWLHTQGEAAAGDPLGDQLDGWLVGVEGLHERRAPGNTCLSALRSGRRGTPEHAINDSKGCGGVMRIAPVGLVARGFDAFDLGCELAALTHGHPSGWLASGYIALLVRMIVDGRALEDAAEEALARLVLRPQAREVARALRAAIDLADQDRAAGSASVESVERLGAGRVAEEALAIGLYCALVAGDDFARGVTLAVDHSGDSDSTGSIAGQILGARLGVDAIPARWLDGLELREVIEAVADDVAVGWQEGEAWWRKYPGW